MGIRTRIAAIVVIALIALAPLGYALAEDAQIPVDSWPKKISAGSDELTIYQPQIESWQGSELQARAAVQVEAPSLPKPTYGVVFFTARTDVDKTAGMVTLMDFRVTRASFPVQSNQSEGFAAAIGKAASNRKPVTIALERLQANLSVTKATNPSHAVPVKNTPPQIIVSYTPALLVLVDGAPALRALAGTNYLRVINTRALILLDQASGKYYLYAASYWYQASDIKGPWQHQESVDSQLNQARDIAEKAGGVTVMSNQAVTSAYAGSVPAIYVSLEPAALIHLKGQPQLQPIASTGLLEVTNTSDDVFLDTTDQNYYVRLTGRWFKSPGLGGPWTFVAANALPRDFAQIPVEHPKADVLASVAGTPQSSEAVIANSVPQTATVQRGSAKLEVKYDGSAKFAGIPGTSLYYAKNTPIPVIMLNDDLYYALQDAVWFTATDPYGPWTAATSVPAVIYTIPASSPLHYVTYVRIYGSTPDVVYTGYTPGYMGTVYVPDGVVVYGTGYPYSAWVGSVWYPSPITYGLGATVAYSTWGGWNVGFGLGYPTYPPYWGPYAFGAGFSAGMLAGRASAGAVWGSGWHGGYNVTVNNIYNHWEPRTVSPRGGNTYNYARVGDTNIARSGGNIYASRDGNVYKNDGGRWRKYGDGNWHDVGSGQAQDRLNQPQLRSLDQEASARNLGDQNFNQFRSAGGLGNPGLAAGGVGVGAGGVGVGAGGVGVGAGGVGVGAGGVGVGAGGVGAGAGGAGARSFGNLGGFHGGGFGGFGGGFRR